MDPHYKALPYILSSAEEDMGVLKHRFRAGIINESQIRASLLALGLDQGTVDLIIEFEQWMAGRYPQK